MLSYNSYHILWLDITSSQKQISKRGKDILKYLAISEVPSFEYDLPFTAKYRNETYVYDALNRLTDPKKRLSDYFFWLNIQSSDDKKIYVKIQNGDYQDAIKLFRPNSDRKNFAILVVLLLWEGILKGDNLVALAKGAMEIFHEIITNDAFWKTFEKEFQLFDDLSTDLWLIEEFRNDLGKNLSDIFYDISKKVGISIIAKDFAEKFHIQWNLVYTQVQELCLSLEKQADEIQEQLKKWGVSEFISEVSEGFIIVASLDIATKRIRKTLHEIDCLGAYDDSRVKVVRDVIAKTIRASSVRIHNDFGKSKEAMDLLTFSIEICGTDWLKHGLAHDRIELSKLIESSTDAIKRGGRSWKMDPVGGGDLIRYGTWFLMFLFFIAIKWCNHYWSNLQSLSSNHSSFEVARDTTEVVRDTTAPKILIDWLGEYTDIVMGSKETYTLRFKVVDKGQINATSLYIDGKPYQALGAGWKFETSLGKAGDISPGKHILTIVATDDSFNKGTKNVGLMIIDHIVVWGGNKPVSMDTPKKEEDPCEKDQCYFNGKCLPKPLHATCVKDDPNNAWSCGAEYEEKDEACWCKSWKYACPSFVNSDDEDREIASLKYQIDTTQVNEYSENSVNTYNALIRKVNALTQTRNQKLNNLCSCR